jgi:hypothetical protein
LGFLSPLAAPHPICSLVRGDAFGGEPIFGYCQNAGGSGGIRYIMCLSAGLGSLVLKTLAIPASRADFGTFCPRTAAFSEGFAGAVGTLPRYDKNRQFEAVFVKIPFQDAPVFGILAFAVLPIPIAIGRITVGLFPEVFRPRKESPIGVGRFDVCRFRHGFGCNVLTALYHMYVPLASGRLVFSISETVRCVFAIGRVNWTSVQ